MAGDTLGLNTAPVECKGDTLLSCLRHVCIIKFNLEQVMKAQRASRDIDLLFL
jgi:hypothetical protein